MSQDAGILRHAAASLALPFTVTILVPMLLLTTGTINPAWGLDAPLSFVLYAAGFLLLLAGIVLIVSTVRLFVTVGRGTLAPWDPPKHLVVRGIYRYVRNPMISGVMSILLGDTLMFGSVPLLVWTIAAIALNVTYIPMSEEPGLRARFGAEYDDYTRHVPRWIPRRTPWIQPGNEALNEAL